jgi:hypothetical protein
LFFVEMAKPWSAMTLRGFFNFLGCDLGGEWRRANAVLADGHHPCATPGNRPNRFSIFDLRFLIFRLRVSTRQSLQNSTHSGQHRGSLPNRKS